MRAAATLASVFRRGCASGCWTQTRGLEMNFLAVQRGPVTGDSTITSTVRVHGPHSARACVDPCKHVQSALARSGWTVTYAQGRMHCSSGRAARTPSDCLCSLCVPGHCAAPRRSTAARSVAAASSGSDALTAMPEPSSKPAGTAIRGSTRRCHTKYSRCSSPTGALMSTAL